LTLCVAGAPGQVPPQHGIMPLPLQAGQMQLDFGGAALLFMAASSAVASHLVALLVSAGFQSE
jgi:hypothetical protein